MFLEQIKDRLGIRAKSLEIHGSEDEYQLYDGQAEYGGWQNLYYENTLTIDAEKTTLSSIRLQKEGQKNATTNNQDA